MRRTIVSVPNLMHDLYEYLFMNQFALQILQNYICIRWKIRVAAKLVSYSVSYIKLIFLKKNSSVSITIILHFKRKRALILLFILLSEKKGESVHHRWFVALHDCHWPYCTYFFCIILHVGLWRYHFNHIRF